MSRKKGVRPMPGFRSVPGLEGFHVSIDGRVQGRNGGIMKPVMRGPGRHKYPGFGYTTADGKIRWFATHRAVCLAFNGPPSTPDHEVAHRDGNPLNPHADNLRWATHQENNQDKIDHGTSGKGSDNPCARLTEREVKEIKTVGRLGRGGNVAELATRYGVSRATVIFILQGKRWGHV